MAKEGIQADAGYEMYRRRVSKAVLKEVRDAFEHYRRRVESMEQLSPATKQTYIGRAEFFKRWLEGDFEPGVKHSR